PEEIARGRELGNHRALCFATDQALTLAVLAALAFSVRGNRLAGGVRAQFSGRAGLAAESLAVGAAVVLALAPLDFYRGWVLEKQLELSTQSPGGWAQDWLLENAIGAVLLVLAVWLVDAVQRRSPRRWWVASWLGLSAGIVVF